MTRMQMIFVSIIGLGFAALLGLAREPACSDPAGCSWFPPGASVFIGIERVSSGPDRDMSQVALQAAALTAAEIQPLEGHSLQIRPLDTSCLPGSLDLAASGIAGDQNIAAALGPVCRQNAVVFAQAIQAASKPFIPVRPSLQPDSLVQQASDLIRRLNLGTHPQTTALTEEDQAIADLLCQKIAAEGRVCQSEDSPETPDLIIVVSWIDSLSHLGAYPVNFNGQPVIVLSLSRPRLVDDPFPYVWIGPAFWGKSSGPANLPKDYDSISALAAREGMSLYASALQSARERRWDGSWVLPRLAFSRQVAQALQHSEFFSITASASPLKGKNLGLTAFQVSGVEYNDLYQ